MRVVVAGATGYIGSRLVPRLLERGHEVRCVVRDPAKAPASRWPGAEVVRADVLMPETLASAFAGADAAYYLVHSMTTGSGDFAAMDREAARNVARAAAEAGLKRIVYLGGLGGERTLLSEHLASRQETGDLLRSGPVPVTELRAAVIIGSGSASFEIIRDLARKLPVMVCPRWVSSRCEPIGIADVLAYLIGVLDEPRTAGETYEIGSGEVYTYAELLRITADVMGRSVRILSVPLLTPRLSSYWLNLVTTVPMSLARPLVEGLRNDVVCTDRRIRALVPVSPTPFREAVSRALARQRPESRWTGATTTVRPETPPGAPLLEDVRRVFSADPPAALFARVVALGGENGWGYATSLWKLRGAIDRLLGGVGMRRGRPDPAVLKAGDALDFWRVESVEEGRLLALRAEMKVPGEARLAFAVEGAPGGSVLVQTARFRPSGLGGRLYWWGLLPVHALIFRGMAARLARGARRAAPQYSGSGVTARHRQEAGDEYSPERPRPRVEVRP